MGLKDVLLQNLCGIIIKKKYQKILMIIKNYIIYILNSQYQKQNWHGDIIVQ